MGGLSAFTVSRMVVGFADLSGFFRASTACAPLQLAEALQRHYGETARIIRDHGGRTIKFIGDAVFFCFPEGSEAAAVTGAGELAAAVTAGIARDLGSAEMALGVGLGAGEVVSGAFGPAEATAFDVFGDPVNAAALICRGPGIRVTEAVRTALGDRVSVAQEAPVCRAGREIAVYRVCPDAAAPGCLLDRAFGRKVS